MVAFIDENEGNYNKAQDFQDERHLTPMAIERLLSKQDKVLLETQKLRNPQLKGKATTRPYSGCYGTYSIVANSIQRSATMNRSVHRTIEVNES